MFPKQELYFSLDVVVTDRGAADLLAVLARKLFQLAHARHLELAGPEPSARHSEVEWLAAGRVGIRQRYARPLDQVERRFGTPAPE
jgi:hypothetical protein